MNAITNISPDLSRRHFLGVSGVLVLGTCLPTRKAAALDVAADTFEPNLFLALDSDGTVRITTHRSEMGQGIRTALAQVVADELDADWSRITVVQAEGDAKYGDQNTDGSKSILLNYDRLRAAGASARLMLRQAAAKRWSVAVDTVTAVNHEVVHEGSGRRLGYGDLAGDAAALPVPGDAPLKKEAEHRFIGKGVTHVDAADIARGKGTFGADFRLPNMATAVVVRCPWLGGGVKNVGNKPTDEPGLVGIEILDPAPSAGPVFAPLGGVAVVAEDTWTAVRIAGQLDIEWTASPNQDFDSDVLRQSLRDALKAPGALVPNSAKGDVDAAFATGGTELEAVYETPFLSHAPMEPPVAVADVSEGRCTVNAPLQDPQSARGLVAQYLRVAPEKVSVTPTLLGGAFGRKSKPDFALEAVELSKRLNRPVRVQWLREDDIRHDYFHAASAQYHRAVIDEDGRPKAWLQRTAFPSITSVFAAQARDPAAWELDMGFSNLPYSVDNQRMEFAGIRPGIRVGWLRSVCNIFHAFSANVFADEMAAAVGRDPIEHRLSMFPASGKLKPPGQQPLPGHELDFGRLRHVVERVRELSAWNKPRPEGVGLGFAVHQSFNSYVATVLEASVAGGQPRVSNAYVVLDCGTYVNPDTCRAQMEGAVVFGLSLALYGDIGMKNGAVVQSNFHDYPMLRIAQAPATTVELVAPQGRLPAGVGEPGVPPVAPALSNALFAATGTRHRTLPIRT
ncbi:MAG: xanthine dehydrogenase family protein molybdopterin-binding subunit [Gammaproteobacteria bacterium]|nr:xanthine dehydrogenase family protein molybdopterin-binding subunit [Gammaproteobacteria bacterium]